VLLGPGGYNPDVAQAVRCDVGKPTPEPGIGILVPLGLVVVACVASAILAAAYVLHGTAEPQVRISSPPSGRMVAEGELVVVQAESSGRGLTRSELLVDGVIAESVSSSRPGGETDWSVAYSWSAQPAGLRRLRVRVFDVSGGVAETSSVVIGVPPPGSIVFSSNRAGTYQLYTMQTDGREVAALTTGPGQRREPCCGGGLQLLFSRSDDGGGSDVWLLRPETGKESNLTPSLGGDRWPRWAPDEESIAFISDRYGTSQLFLMDPDGAGQLQLTQEEFPVEQPSWAPDGSALLVAADSAGNWDIYSTSIDGQSLTRLTEDPAQDDQPAWSPGGNEIAFVSDREGNRQIYVMNSDGSGQRRITAFPSGAEQPRWSPDGAWIACVGFTGHGQGLDAREIYIMRSDGSDQMRLTDNSSDDTEPDWCEWNE
jgi:Tol biopolymer transport system component